MRHQRRASLPTFLAAALAFFVAAPLHAEARRIPPYDREQWEHWTDDDNDCQDTRAEVLIAESLIPVNFVTDRRCFVSAGLWIDLYTGATYSDARRLQVDHLVSLHDAHHSGGYRWGASRKRAFANDRRNLVPVEASINQGKGSRQPDAWTPALRDIWCWYAVTYRSVKETWRLRTSDSTREAIDELRKSCLGESRRRALRERGWALPLAPRNERAVGRVR